MSYVLALTLVLLAACRNNSPSLDSQYREVRSNLHSELYDLALPKAESALELALRNGTEKDRWRFRLLKADILIGQRQNAKALAWVNKCGQPPQGPEWAEERAHALLLKGRATSELNRVAEAEQLLAQASIAAREARSDSLAAEVKLRQGKVLVQQSRFEEARRDFRDVADTAAKTHDLYLEATAIGSIGVALLTESRNDEAIPWFEKALALFSQSGAGESVARTHGNLGNCYFRLGDYEQARSYYAKAREFFAKTGNRDGQQIWIGNGANVAYATGDFASAAKDYERALELARQAPSPIWVARWLNNLAETSLELGRWDEAEKYNKETLAATQRLKDSNWEPTFLGTAARIEEGRGHPDRARELFRAALSKPAEDPSVEIDSHAGLARTWVSEGNANEAEAEFRNSVAIIEHRRANLLKDDYKLPYLSSVIGLYQEYVDFLVSRHQPEKALEVAESSRARVLESRLMDRNSELRASLARETSADYKRLARDSHAVVLEYWLGPHHSYLWVITAQKIQLHELPPRAEIHSLIENYRQVIAGARNPLDVAGETGRRLYDALIEPVGDAGRAGRFLIVPDQDLYSFDLETLPAPNQAGKFWIEKATVSIAPSLNFVAGASRFPRSGPANGLLVMGDPPGAGSLYPRLEYAAQEIDSISRSVHNTSAAVLRGTQATPDAYRNAQPGQFGFIHFAAHAMANSQSPLDSAIILAGPPDANRLLARNVMAVPLNAELVTISACRSAGGKAYAGEGLVGFAWAFLRAGARNVIAGLWDVSDRSTEELMASLYNHIAAGEELPAALRDAKLELIRKGGAYAKPFYWAPFQLYAGGRSAKPGASTIEVARRGL